MSLGVTLYATDSASTPFKPFGHDSAMLFRQLSRFGWAWNDFTVTTDPRIALQARCIVPLDPAAFTRVTGLSMTPLLARGYVFPAGNTWAVPILPASYYRADTGMLATFLSDMQRAVAVAATPTFRYRAIDAHWEPPLDWWQAFVAEFLRDSSRPLAADIETPYKRRAEMSEEEKNAAEDITYTIDEINFSYMRGQGVSVPWRAPYIDGALAMLRASQAHGTTLWWNGSYDMPRIEAASDVCFSARHTRDVMDLFRLWRNSVRRKLVVATSLVPENLDLPPWKHLGTDDPFYRAMDVVALLENDIAITAAVKREGAWDAYRLFMADLDPHLEAMTQAGVAVDRDKVVRLSAELEARLIREQAAMTALVPPDICGEQVWKTLGAAETGLARLKAAGEVPPEATLEAVPSTASAMRCAACGAVGVTAAHVTRKFLLDSRAEGA